MSNICDIRIKVSTSFIYKFLCPKNLLRFVKDGRTVNVSIQIFDRSDEYSVISVVPFWFRSTNNPFCEMCFLNILLCVKLRLLKLLVLLSPLKDKYI